MDFFSYAKPACCNACTTTSAQGVGYFTQQPFHQPQVALSATGVVVVCEADFAASRLIFGTTSSDCSHTVHVSLSSISVSPSQPHSCPSYDVTLPVAAMCNDVVTVYTRSQVAQLSSLDLLLHLLNHQTTQA